MNEIDDELSDPVRRPAPAEYGAWLEGWADLAGNDDPHVDAKIEALLEGNLS